MTHTSKLRNALEKEVQESVSPFSCTRIGILNEIHTWQLKRETKECISPPGTQLWNMMLQAKRIVIVLK